MFNGDLKFSKCSGIFPLMAFCTRKQRWIRRRSSSGTHDNSFNASLDETLAAVHGIVRTMFYFDTSKLKGLFRGSHMTTTRYLRTYCSVTQLQALRVNISYCHSAGYFLKFTESKKFVRFIKLFMSQYIRCSLQNNEQLF